MTDYLSRYGPPPTLEVPPTVLTARAALAEAAADLLAVPDGALERAWPWREGAADVRYGLYRQIEALEEDGAAVGRALAESGATRSPAARRIAPATAARWDLHGLLAALSADDLDADPSGGEWTIRQTLGHIVLSQRAYGDGTAWWLGQPTDGNDFPKRLPETVVEEMAWPTEEEDGAGALPEIRARLDGWLDLTGARLGDPDDAALGHRARWSGIAVDVGFRLGRLASHIAEHTLQIDKTLDWLGYEPSEPVRIVRDLYAAWGRLEARIFPVAPRGTDTAVAEILQRCSAQLVSDARSVRAAAEP